MIPYFLLLLIPGLFSGTAITIRKKQGRKTVLSISKSEKSAIIPTFFALLLILLIIRHESIGRDLPTYRYMFESYSPQGMDYVIGDWKESLFRVYNWGIYQFTDNFQIWMALAAVICVYPIAHVYDQDRTHGYIKIALFVNMSTFIMLFSGIRQSMAMAVGMLAYQMVKERKMVKWLILSFVAMLFHHSAFMLFFMYPLYHIRFRKVHLLVIIPAILALFVFNAPIFNFLTSILGESSYKYDAEATETGAFMSLVLFVLFTVFVYVILDDKKCDAEMLGLRNFLLMTVALQCFAPVHTLAMRMNYYYIIFIPIAVGKSLNYVKQNMKQVAKLGEIVMCCFFTAYFIYTTYRSYVTGISTLDTIPYRFFWQEV